jgi:CRISPR type I-D-associated protein Csc1
MSKDSTQELIYKCRLVAHDYLFFSTKGFRDTTMTNYIGNYALMYAINRNIREVQRNASGTVPFYEEDMPKMSIYATPASISSEHRIPTNLNEAIPWENQPQIYITFNSVNTITQLTETERANLPQIGRKAKHPPLNSFDFFAVGGNPSGLIRLGKKQVPCRIYAFPLAVDEISSSVFQSSHPINLQDLTDWTYGDIKNAELIRQTPPLLVNARLKAQHYVCSDGVKKYKIIKPDAGKYRNVRMP